MGTFQNKQQQTNLLIVLKSCFDWYPLSIKNLQSVKKQTCLACSSEIFRFTSQDSCGAFWKFLKTLNIENEMQKNEFKLF